MASAASAASASAVKKKHHSLESCIVDSQQLAQNIITEIEHMLPSIRTQKQKLRYQALRNAIGFMQDNRHRLYNHYEIETDYYVPDTDSTLELCSAYHDVLSYVHDNLSDITKLNDFLNGKARVITKTNKAHVYYQTLFWIYDRHYDRPGGKRSRKHKKSHKKKGGKRSHRRRH